MGGLHVDGARVCVSAANGRWRHQMDRGQGGRGGWVVDEVEEAQGGMMPPSRGSLHARPVMPAQRGSGGGGGFYVPETQL